MGVVHCHGSNAAGSRCIEGKERQAFSPGKADTPQQSAHKEEAHKAKEVFTVELPEDINGPAPVLLGTRVEDRGSKPDRNIVFDNSEPLL